MRTSLTIAAATAALAAGGIAAAGAGATAPSPVERRPRAPGTHVEGRVTAIDRSARTFTVRDAERGTLKVKVTSSTKFERVTFTALRTGTRVDVRAKRVAGAWNATKVERGSASSTTHDADDDHGGRPRRRRTTTARATTSHAAPVPRHRRGRDPHWRRGRDAGHLRPLAGPGGLDDERAPAVAPARTTEDVSGPCDEAEHANDARCADDHVDRPPRPRRQSRGPSATPHAARSEPLRVAAPARAPIDEPRPRLRRQQRPWRRRRQRPRRWRPWPRPPRRRLIRRPQRPSPPTMRA